MKEKKTEVKKAEEKAVVKQVKAADKEGVFVIQNNGNDYTIADIKERCIKAYRGDSRKHVKTIDVYVNFENGALRAYYVVNGKAEGAYIDL